MATVKENLIAAKACYDANSIQWSLNQAIDYVAEYDNDNADEAYTSMSRALSAAMQRVPPPSDRNLVRWSHGAGKPEIMALFDRAIAAQDDQP